MHQHPRFSFLFFHFPQHLHIDKGPVVQEQHEVSIPKVFLSGGGLAAFQHHQIQPEILSSNQMEDVKFKLKVFFSL